MKSFKQFLIESDFWDHMPTSAHKDEWLRGEQRHADKNMHSPYHGMVGSITGSYKTLQKLPVKELINIKGANGEEDYRESTTSSKYRSLEKQVGNPSNFNSEKNPILIGVNHYGKPYVLEGNHRLAYAHKNGISHIHAEIRYWNGGERVDGPMHPDKIEKMKNEET